MNDWPNNLSCYDIVFTVAISCAKDIILQSFFPSSDFYILCMSSATVCLYVCVRVGGEKEGESALVESC